MHKILDEDENFLHRQGKEKETKGRLKKAALFASQTLFSDPINNPAFEAHLQQFTNYSTSFFHLSTPRSQTTTTSSFVLKEEADQVIHAFSEIKIKGLSDIQELVSLTALSDINVYRALIRVLLKEVLPQDNLLPNPFLLSGLSVVLERRAKCEQDDLHLVGDSVQVFETLVDLLQNIHIDKNHQQVEAVLQTLSLLLDQMVYFNVQVLKQEAVRRLHNALNLIKGEKQSVLSWRVQYIKQALIRIPDNAAFLDAFKTRLPPAIGGLAYLSTFGLKAAAGVISGGIVGSLDLNNLWEAYQCFVDSSKEITHKKYKAWYGELRLLDLLIETNQVKKIGELFPTENQTSESWIKQLAHEEFVWGLCDRLERLAYSAHQPTRDDALRLLKSFKESKTPWEPHKGAQDYAAICLNRIARTWSLDLEQIEATGYFPSIWNDQVWQENISQVLLKQVRDKAKVRQHMALMPADIANTRTTLTEVVSSGVEQLSVQIAHSHTQLQISISELTGRLLPKPPRNNWLPQVNEALAQHYQPALKIQRISGKALDLADCYINLAIVEGKEQQEADKAKLKAQASTFYRPSSYEEVKQANLQTPIPLENLFDQRKLRNGQEGAPKRILIQGRAGIGKTTLCKKVVHAYQQGLWQDRFDAVLWVPLRQLKTYGAYHLEELLKEKYFLQRTDKEPLARQLSDHTQKILFVLDGLDEVAAELAQETKLGSFLNYLLAQPQVVVTSRPTGVDPTKLEAFDLELETIGFRQENIQAYLEKVEPEFAPKIQALIECTPVMQELANIPIQLDVLCYSWKEIEAKLKKQKAKTPEAQVITLTAATLYQEMVDKLLRKDAERLDKKNNGESWSVRSLKNAGSEEIEQIMDHEIAYLSYLSFKGLEQNKIEFDFYDLSEIRRVLNQVRAQRQEPSLPISVYEDLEKTSFLHTADASLDEDERAYHFLHLTFQEFFVAKFLAKHFEAYLTAEGTYQSPTEVIGKGLALALKELQDFVAQYIYNSRYQIVWGMVAGLLEGNTLEGFFHLLEKVPRNLEKDTHIDLIMLSLHEARARLSQSTIARLEDELAKALELAVKSRREDGEPIRLGQEPTFPEHLLLELIEQHREYREVIYQILGHRQTLTNKAAALFERVLRDTDCDIKIILEWGLGNYAVSVDTIQAALLKRFEEEKELDAIVILALVLGLHAGDVDVIQAALRKRLEEEKEQPRVIGTLAAGLARYADDVDAIRIALLKRFGEEKELEVIGALAVGLGQHAGDVDAIQVALLKRVEKEKEPKVIAVLAAALALHAVDVDVIQAALLKRLEEEKEPEVIKALTLGLAQADDVDAIQVALLKRFEEESRRS